ncbi:hypothetical protein PHSY_003870 [Pseudozyma hubeiensis SY62]|uniref:Uncharacterized protein n=1 Tax=Pseudozyma hubeiensis (strain SY62) TaxID=1305764 RepID=R9PDY0_PSEHS|nr:hypothetical protein PHSY_003870 [Pseudozyma hubeiensis SY62]GAC96290.1 hypothetical protein PHSY_003870 [Pseudozyma hubeiensis SY62]
MQRKDPSEFGKSKRICFHKFEFVLHCNSDPAARCWDSEPVFNIEHWKSAFPAGESRDVPSQQPQPQFGYRFFHLLRSLDQRRLNENRQSNRRTLTDIRN